MNIRVLPEEIDGLKNLTHLRLGHNKLEFIPENLGNMESLVDLDLSYNKLSSYPESFLNLGDKLYRLYINGNEFTYQQMQELGDRLPKLVYKDW